MNPLRSYAESEELSIGVLLCLTGECAEWGNNSLRGIELAEEEINQRGGVLGRKLKLVVEDTSEGDGGAKAVVAFSKLRQNNALTYFIGPSWTTGGLAIAPIAAKATNLVITSPSLGVADFNESSDHTFTMWPHDANATKILARYALEKQWKKAAIFSSQQPWEAAQGNTFDAEFSKRGGTITSKQEPLPSDTDLKAEALKIKSSLPDVVFLSDFNQMGIAARQLRASGYTGPLLAILMDDSRIAVASGALEGAIFARYHEPTSTFANSFQQKFSTKPGITADTAYDTLKLYALAIGKAGTAEPTIVKDEIRKIEFEGASGHVVFDDAGAIERTPELFVVKGVDTERLR